MASLYLLKVWLWHCGMGGSPVNLNEVKLSHCIPCMGSAAFTVGSGTTWLIPSERISRLLHVMAESYS